MSDQKNTPDKDQETSLEETAQQPLPEEEAESADASEATPEPPPPPAAASKGIGLLAAFLAVIALAAIAGLGWLGYERSEQLNRQLAAVERSLDSKPDQDQVAELRDSLDQLSRLDSEQNQLKERLESYQQEVQQHQEKLDALHADLLKASEPKPRDWQLAEVEYLLRLANQRLQLEDDLPGALTLFKTAQQRLKAAQVPGTLAVRQALASDIAELESLKVIDRVSLALDLQALADRVLRLEIQPLTEAPALSLDRSDEAASQPWYQLLWEEIKSLVVIRSRDLPLEPLPFAEDEQALKYQISSLLQQAAWASLRGKEDLYQQSLERATERFLAFDQEVSSHREIKQQLQDFKATPVRQEQPRVETSLDRLQTFIAERYQRLLPVMEDALEDES